ncbi:MAG: IS200/IS605 family transposase [Muribaculaceae bacterium]|nr:IS200/IS605 family transposase [Muribaculaceae bacterium]
MSNTYSQIYLHVVFAVKYRRAQIPLDKREEIYNYIAGIVSYNKCKLMCIGGVSDHVHLLISLSPTVCLSKLMQSVKIGSSNFISGQHYSDHPFHWQEGYGAFSVSAIHINVVTDYINNQFEHHSKTSFLNEYRQLLGKNDVIYNPDYIFKELQ